MIRVFACDVPGCTMRFKGTRHEAVEEGWGLGVGAQINPDQNHTMAMRELVYTICPNHMGDGGGWMPADVVEELIWKGRP